MFVCIFGFILVSELVMFLFVSAFILVPELL